MVGLGIGVLSIVKTLPMPITEADFHHVKDERFRRLVAYWLGARAEGQVPTLAAIDPAGFPYLLEQVWLCAVEEEPRAFRYRLAGDHIRAAYTQSLNGRTLAELTDPAVVDRVMGYFNRVVDEPAIVHIAGRIYSEESHPARGERLILPFADRRHRSDHPHPRGDGAFLGGSRRRGRPDPAAAGADLHPGRRASGLVRALALAVGGLSQRVFRQASKRALVSASGG